MQELVSVSAQRNEAALKIIEEVARQDSEVQHATPEIISNWEALHATEKVVAEAQQRLEARLPEVDNAGVFPIFFALVRQLQVKYRSDCKAACMLTASHHHTLYILSPQCLCSIQPANMRSW